VSLSVCGFSHHHTASSLECLWLPLPPYRIVSTMPHRLVGLWLPLPPYRIVSQGCGCPSQTPGAERPTILTHRHTRQVGRTPTALCSRQKSLILILGAVTPALRGHCRLTSTRGTLLLLRLLRTPPHTHLLPRRALLPLSKSPPPPPQLLTRTQRFLQHPWRPLDSPIRRHL